MLPVIHFSTLNDMLSEFNGDGRQIIRVSHHQRSETKSGQYTLITIQVFVRAFHRGAILSYVALSEEIRAAGHEPRPGIIDLGGVQPVVGEQWPLSEADHVE